MRLFVAMDLPASVEDTLMELRERADPREEKARWAHAGSVHLTLKFLGEVPGERIDEITDALGGIEAVPLEIRVTGIGVFPNRRSPRILWAGIESPELGRLQAEVESRLAAIGFPREDRPFRPHVTLARASRKRTLTRTLVERAEEMGRTEFGRFTARALFLYRSRPENKGTVHEKLAEILFSARN